MNWTKMKFLIIFCNFGVFCGVMKPGPLSGGIQIFGRDGEEIFPGQWKPTPHPVFALGNTNTDTTTTPTVTPWPTEPTTYSTSSLTPWSHTIATDTIASQSKTPPRSPWKLQTPILESTAVTITSPCHFTNETEALAAAPCNIADFIMPLKPILIIENDDFLPDVPVQSSLITYNNHLVTSPSPMAPMEPSQLNDIQAQIEISIQFGQKPFPNSTTDTDGRNSTVPSAIYNEGKISLLSNYILGATIYVLSL